MVFDLTKHFVPEVYSDSRDFRIFLRMLEILFSVIKYNADHFTDLYDPADCPENLLPYLASMVGYDYDSAVSIDNNRIIIKYFPYLIRNRGNEIGVKLATALSLGIHTNIDDYINLDDLRVDYDYQKGIITVYYPKNAKIKKYLLEVVRPVGTTLELVPFDNTEAHENFNVEVKARIYNRYDDNTIDKSQVSFSGLDPTESEVTPNG